MLLLNLRQNKRFQGRSENNNITSVSSGTISLSGTHTSASFHKKAINLPVSFWIARGNLEYLEEAQTNMGRTYKLFFKPK